MGRGRRAGVHRPHRLGRGHERVCSRRREIRAGRAEVRGWEASMEGGPGACSLTSPRRAAGAGWG